MSKLNSNPHVIRDKPDFLYHLGIDTSELNLKTLFNDVKFVCLGGSQNRMLKFAKFLNKHLNESVNEPFNYAHKTDRYCVYKIAGVLTVSHGIGVPSLSVVINEIFKLLFYAECSDVIFVRLGTSGGIGIEPGTVVITDNVVNGELKPIFSYTRLGERVSIPTHIDSELVKELFTVSNQSLNYTIVCGTTYSVDSFYEAQGRTDGALCDYSKDDKKKFLKKLKDNGVKNIEMESLGLFALCHRAGYKAAMIAVTLVNRLEADEPCSNIELLKEWEERPFHIILHFIRSRMKNLLN